MKLWVWTSSTFLLLLLCWSLIVTASVFTDKELQLITKQVQEKYKISGQYAYAIKFAQNECNSLTDTVIMNALKDDKANDVQAAIKAKDIYLGQRLTMAKFRKTGKGTEHSEFRLLYPLPGTDTSPVQELLNKAPAAGCALFYTYNSPCQAYCTDPSGPFNIVPKLDQFSRINNSAFAYSQVYHEQGKSCCPDRLGLVNAKMHLYRCPGECFKCFITLTSTINNKCIT